MNESDQRLYKILLYGGCAHLLEGDRHINDKIVTLLGLSRSIFCDYMNIDQDMYDIASPEIISRLIDMFEEVVIKRNFGINGCIICGLAIRECIDER